MKHDDFQTLELEKVLTQVLTWVKVQCKASAVHWASGHGLKRVKEASSENWNWAFTAADVIGTHMWSQPASDMWALYQLWSHVNSLYPDPQTGVRTAQMALEPHPRFVYPVYFENRFLGLLTVDRPTETNPVALMGAIKGGLDVASKYLAFAYEVFDAKNLSYIDEVTGLHNQRYLPMVLEHEIQRAKRENGQFTLLFLDIDFFKMVNDGRGHWVGSRLLEALGSILKSQVRTCDYTFRYGGDEFIVVLSNAGVEGGKIVAERIRKAVEEQTFEVEGHRLNLTVSIGLASYPTHAKSVVELITIADQAMYDGKRKSRNIVFIAS